ncbi:MAG: radical SAM family heme chaperone HemW [Vicinamibacterales bacterium]
MIGLYLHIPFCQAICSYCNFNRGLFDAGLKSRYVSALAREILGAGDGQGADTVFFGGGTPSLLEPADVAVLVEACASAYALTADAEITLETNPETVTIERLAAFRAAGVNRLSIGVQSFDDAQLRRLGRIHTAAKAGAAVRAARAAGFDNVSLDLMFWLPGQSRASWLDSVGAAISLAPDHLSLYLLELYPNAPLKEAMARAETGTSGVGNPDTEWRQSADDEAADMYLEGLALFDQAGFAQYEISNVARSGRVSRHNLKYWTGGEWRGFGCGAHSTVGMRRWKNVASTSDYVAAIDDDREVVAASSTLTHSEQVGDALFTGLRLSAGINRADFAHRYGLDPWERYGRDLASCVDAGLVWHADDRFGLSREGMLLSNEILALFV